MTCKNTIKLTATNSTLFIISLRGKSKTLFLSCCTLSPFLHTQIPLPPDFFFVRRMQNPSQQSTSVGRRRTVPPKGTTTLGHSFHPALFKATEKWTKVHFSYFMLILWTTVKPSSMLFVSSLLK